MKLALVYDAIYPYIKGGGEKRFYDIGTKLAKKNHEVHLYGMKFWEGENVIKRDGIYLHGICKEKPLYVNNKRSIKQAIYFGLNCFKLIKEDFDAIDCCGFPYFSLFPAKLTCIIKGKKLNSTWHEVWGKDYWKEYLGWKGIFGYWIEKIASKLPDKIIAVSEDTKKNLIEKLRVLEEKIIVIPNAIDIEKIEKVKPSKETSDVIFAGRLLSHKNIDVLIRTIAILKPINPAIKCIIIGDGVERENLQNLVKTLKLDKNIIFKGFLEKLKDVYGLIKSSKVFVLPSSREGFGITVIEANACGIPVVTVNHKGNASKDLIKEGHHGRTPKDFLLKSLQGAKNGFVCELNEKDLARGILRGMKEGKEMKKDCIEIVKKYDWDEIVGKVEEIYKIGEDER